MSTVTKKLAIVHSALFFVVYCFVIVALERVEDLVGTALFKLVQMNCLYEILRNYLPCPNLVPFSLRDARDDFIGVGIKCHVYCM